MTHEMATRILVFYFMTGLILSLTLIGWSAKGIKVTVDHRPEWMKKIPLILFLYAIFVIGWPYILCHCITKGEE